MSDTLQMPLHPEIEPHLLFQHRRIIQGRSQSTEMVCRLISCSTNLEWVQLPLLRIEAFFWINECNLSNAKWKFTIFVHRRSSYASTIPLYLINNENMVWFYFKKIYPYDAYKNIEIIKIKLLWIEDGLSYKTNCKTNH